MNMDSFISHSITFLIGAATGAAGTYLADKFTDQRRDKEEQSKAKRLFEETARKMPDLIAEMRMDLSQPEHATFREFFVIDKGISLWASPNSLVYEEHNGNDYLNKVRILESCGYVIDVTPHNAPMFRMREHFVEFLTATKPCHPCSI